MKRKTGRKLLSFLLTLALVIGLMPGMSMTAYASTEKSETITTTVSALSGAVDTARAAVQAADKKAADAKAANEAIAKIKALPDNAGVSDKAAVEAARAAYEALTDDQKKLVGEDVLKKLITAEAQVQAAEEEAGKIDINACKITVKNVTYTGKAVTAKAMKRAVTVKYGGKKLKYGTEYTLSYSKKLKAVGKATVTVVGKGKYRGSKKLKFKIIPKGTAISKVTGGDRQIRLRWKKRKGVRGYQIQYSVNKNFSKSRKVKINRAKTVEKTIKSLKAGTRYYVRIRNFAKVKNKTYYSKWSKTKSVKTKGKKANDVPHAITEDDAIILDLADEDLLLPADEEIVEETEMEIDSEVELPVE